MCYKAYRWVMRFPSLPMRGLVVGMNLWDQDIDAASREVRRKSVALPAGTSRTAESPGSTTVTETSSHTDYMAPGEA